MITRQQRKFYAVIVGILFGLGMILYGGIAYFNDLTTVILFGILGGILLGGLASGIILFGRYMKQRRSTALIVLACVLAPVTMFVIMAVGMYGVIPYYIYNLVVIKRIKEGDARASTMQTTKRTKKAVGIVVVCIIAAVIIGLKTYQAINDSLIAQEVFTKTGYTVGSTDHLVLKEYYYHDGVLEDGKYDYFEQDGVLFVLAKRSSEIYSNIYHANRYGEYIGVGKVSRSIFSSKTFMRHDIDRLFSSIKIENTGEVFALMLTIDARSDNEHIADYLDGIARGWSNEKTRKSFVAKEHTDFIISHIDRTYADTDELTITDENGEAIQTMTHGNYTVYCDVIRKNNKDYKWIVSYKGDTYTLLTYEDIAAFNITNKS